MRKLIEKFFYKMRNSALAYRVLLLFGGGEKGLGKYLTRFMFRWYRTHPTVTMRESVSFFRKNEERIRDITKLLADEKSVYDYHRMIEFRSTLNLNRHPGYCMPQYFPKDIITYGNDEVFVDCGGYDGLTSVEFAENCPNYKGIVMFEPDPKNISKIQQQTGLDHSRTTMIKKGCWNKETKLCFLSEGTSSSKVIEDDREDKNYMRVPVTAIDLCGECQDATFIKMDIEGSEMKALEGARETIIRNKPKLAICIYHSDEDMLRIIEYIHRLVPEYRIYVRQHTAFTGETVAYFVC